MAKRNQTGRAEAYALFDTALGVCGVAWSSQGLTRLQLPESDPAATQARLMAWDSRAVASNPTPEIATAIAQLRRYFKGERIELNDIALDLGGISPFYQSVYAATRALAWGQTTSYGALAVAVGSPGAARAIGQAMSRNPVPIIVPCHRVLASGSKPGGFSSFGGTLTKGRLLAMEGVTIATAAPLLALMAGD